MVGFNMSKTFCPLPWKHLATHPHGAVTLCCEAEHRDRLSESFDNGLTRTFKTLHTTEYDFDEIMNSESFSKVRQMMLNGEEPPQCKRCFDLERANIKSKRQFDSERLNFTEEQAIRITNADGTINEVDYEFVELRLGNHCNVACRTCNPFSTSRWVKDWNRVNPENPQTINQSLFNWPLDQNFWDKLLQCSEKLRFIYINGGEPLLVDKHLHFLKQLVDLDRAKNITLVYSTNCTVINTDYEDVWKQFQHVQLMLSIDDLEERNSYIRHPTKWEKVLNVIDWVKTLANSENISYNIMQTISAYNIFYMKEFHEYFSDVPYISLNFVTDPSYLDPSYLPEGIKTEIMMKLSNCEFFPTVESFLMQRTSNLVEEFYNKTILMDEIRKQNFAETFPELYDMVKQYVK